MKSPLWSNKLECDIKFEVRQFAGFFYQIPCVYLTHRASPQIASTNMAGHEGGYERVEIVGKQEPSAAMKLIYESQQPVVFKGMIDHWKASQWTVGFFCRNFGDLPTTFKVCPIHTVEGSDTKKPVMETECVYIKGKFADFIHWLRGDYGKCASLRQFPRYTHYRHVV